EDRPAGGEARRQADAAAVSAAAWKVVVAEGAQLTLEELARQIGAEVRGDRTRRVRGVAGLAEAGPEEVAFFANPRYRAELKRTRAAAVIPSEDEAELAPEGAARLIAPQPYVVVGSDGFGFAFDLEGDGEGPIHRKVPQAGIARIEDDVELGACTCVDRATLGETVVGRGTKVDNLVQIGHNVRIGPLSLI